MGYIKSIKHNCNKKIYKGLDIILRHPIKAAIIFLLIILSFYLKVHEINTGSGDEFYGSDAYSYNDNVVKFIDTGAPISAHVNPLEMLFMIPVYFLFGKSLFAAKFIQILFSFLISFFLYKVGKKYFGETGGFLAAALALIHPSIIYYSAHTWTEFWLIFCTSLIMYLYVVAIDNHGMRKKACFFIGLIGAIGAMSKLWILPAAGIFFLLLILKNAEIKNFLKKEVWKPILIGTILFFVGVLIIIAPWDIYASNQLKYPVYFINSNSASNLYIGNNPDGEVAYTSKPYNFDYAKEIIINEGDCKTLLADPKSERYDYFFQKCTGKYAVHYILSNPGKFISKMWTFTFDYWLFPNLEFYQRMIRSPRLLIDTLWMFWILASIGLLASLQRWKQFIPYYFAILIAWFYFGLSFYLARYKGGLAPLEILFAAGGLATLHYFSLQLFKSTKKEKD